MMYTMSRDIFPTHSHGLDRSDADFVYRTLNLLLLSFARPSFCNSCPITRHVQFGCQGKNRSCLVTPAQASFRVPYATQVTTHWVIVHKRSPAHEIAGHSSPSTVLPKMLWHNGKSPFCISSSCPQLFFFLGSLEPRLGTTATLCAPKSCFSPIKFAVHLLVCDCMAEPHN